MFSEEHLLLETRLHRRGNQQFKQIASVDLHKQAHQIIAFELWSGESRSTGFFHFVKAWSVDLGQWIQSGAMQRWYEVDISRHSRKEIPTDRPEYIENVEQLSSSAAYVCISIADVDKPRCEVTSPSNEQDTVLSTAMADPRGFRLILPHRSIAKSSRFRAARVGKVIHERSTDVLHDLMPMTLYGRANVAGFYSSNGKKMNEADVDVAKALVLLQFSCQYASYCVNQLHQYSSDLEKRSCRNMTKADKLKQRRHLLKERKASLKSESQLLSKSIDRMRMLLKDIDPQALTQLHDDGSQNVSDTEV